MAEDGRERHIGYYRERARGSGMIVVEPVPVHATAVLTRGNFLPDDDAVVPHFRRLTDTCHEVAGADGGVVMIQQLYHIGQHGDAANSFRENWSPSGRPRGTTPTAAAMTADEIEAHLRARRAARGRRAA
jgi:2,4-dienoyl-CoA reductase-like NADH-dependent reductase (Old Yellow Enzyme family)